MTCVKACQMSQRTGTSLSYPTVSLLQPIYLFLGTMISTKISRPCVLLVYIHGTDCAQKNEHFICSVRVIKHFISLQKCTKNLTDINKTILLSETETRNLIFQAYITQLSTVIDAVLDGFNNTSTGHNLQNLQELFQKLVTAFSNLNILQFLKYTEYLCYYTRKTSTKLYNHKLNLG